MSRDQKRAGVVKSTTSVLARSFVRWRARASTLPSTRAAHTGALLLLLSLSAYGWPGSAAAQTGQFFSVQGSALYAGLFGEAFEDITDGFGLEGQLRITPSALSIGAGFQYTVHDASDVAKQAFPTLNWDITLSGGFVEPRYVIPVGETMAPYLSARLSLLRLSINVTGPGGEASGNSTGSTINGGGGILVRVADRVNLDLGATYGYTSFGDAEIRGPGGSETIDIGSGQNAVVRLGLAIGIR